jgi:PAS domain S-box-containing protein
MNPAEFQLRGVSDPRLVSYATSVLPAWLWSHDGTRILWANPVGARLFGAANGATLAKKIFGPADSHRRQVARLAGRLPPTGATRLERLRGFGAPLGTLVTCGCARLDFADGSHGILVAGAEAVGRAMPLLERLQRLVEGIDAPVAAFARDGRLIGASDAARSLPGFGDLAGAGLSEAGLGDAYSEALKQGRVETSVGKVHMTLQRVGTGADTGLVALFAADTTRPAPDDEQPAASGEAPAEFALIDEFAEWPAEAAVEHAEGSPEAATLNIEVHEDEPSPYVEAVADEPPPDTPRHPLRFMWRIDGEGRFSLDPGEFTRLIGAHSANFERPNFERPWREIIESPGLDPDGRVVKAIAARECWIGVTLNWPLDGGCRLPVELSGLPVYDRARNFVGYRGFGVCADLEGLARLAALRRDKFFERAAAPATLSPVIVQPNSAHIVETDIVDDSPAADLPAPDVASSSLPESPAPMALENSHQTELETLVETPKNVVPFRPIGDPKSAGLTPVESSAFDELARQLSERLDCENGTEAAALESPDATESTDQSPDKSDASEPPSEQPGWLASPEAPARGEARRDRMLLDLVPVGVLIYRLDRLLYANRAFLVQMGYENLHALEQAGGLDALYVAPGVSNASSTSETGTPVTISGTEASSGDASAAIDARLFTISWDDDSALALIFSGAAAETAAVAAAFSEPIPAAAPSAAGHANAEELGAILDTTAEGILMFDAEGNINSCNRSAEALFGYDGAELVQRNLAELFAPESQLAVLDYLDGIKSAEAASLLDHGRDLLGRVREGGIIPMSMTMGRTRPDGPNFFAVFRDLSQNKKSESEPPQTRRPADSAAHAKADMLARISHEIRTPLNAIIGFSEVMIGERFGALGNERYIEYMKDIRSSGERVIAIVNDLLDLSRIETGRLDLTFANQNLNDLVEQCVAVMQPQANRERIIIRTSLAQMLPPVLADARSLRQITLNLIGNSIHLANAGGQVIVSTALSDFGEVVLRVRDTGQGLNDSEVAAAMEPFRTQGPSDQASDNGGVSLSLTKALVEANRAHFHIKTGSRSGTLIEVTFVHAMAKA